MINQEILRTLASPRCPNCGANSLSLDYLGQTFNDDGEDPEDGYKEYQCDKCGTIFDTSDDGVWPEL